MMRALAVLLALLTACDDAGGGADPTPDRGPAADAAPLDQAVPDAAEVADADVADAGPDARVPLMPDEQPTDGPATLTGAPDLAAAVPAGRARAGRVDTPGEALTGPDARCRPGCFRLDNALISVCIQGESTFSQLTFQGGNIIDAYPADRPGTDRLREVVISPGLGEISVERIGIVRDGADGGPAILRTEGRLGGNRTIQAYLPGTAPAPVAVTTEYRLAPDAGHVDVLTWLTAEAPAGFLMADLVMFGDRTDAFFPGGPPDAAPGGQMDFLAASAEDVAYGWAGVAGPIAVINIPIDAFPLRPVTHGQLALQTGDTLLLRRRFLVGHDIEDLRDPPEAFATVTLAGPPGAWIDVDDGERQITRAHLAADGTRTVKLAPGAYRARPIDWAGGEPEPVWFTAGTDDRVVLPLPEPARLRVRVRDDGDRGIGAKLVLASAGEERIEFILAEGELALPAGDWRVVTTRGWHYTVDDRVVTLEAGVEANLDLRLTEVIPFDGYSAGEFHQHATSSLDSEVQNRRRVLANIAEGVGFMVPSDHDVIFDFRGLAEQMGVLDRIALPLPGVEISPTFGHLGAYGIKFAADAGAGGAPPLAVQEGDRWRVRTTVELVEDARARGATVIQMNHPRDSAGWFNTIGYAPEIPIEALDSPNWTTDFETVEVYNGQTDFCQVLADWLGLLNQGLRITAVGNSDTHGESRAPGYPRNYVRTAGAAAHEVTGAEVTNALREGRSIVTGGAVLDFPFGPGPGDTVVPDAGSLRVHVRLRTPPYTGIRRLVAFHRGAAVFDRELAVDDAAIIDLDEEIAIPIEGDGPLVLLALGNPRLPYIAGGPVFALANPIWIDADADGTITPVGPGPIALPAMSICE